MKPSAEPAAGGRACSDSMPAEKAPCWQGCRLRVVSASISTLQGRTSLTGRQGGRACSREGGEAASLMMTGESASRAALTKHCRPRGSARHRAIPLQSGRLESKMGLAGLKPGCPQGHVPWRIQGRPGFLTFPRFPRRPRSLADGPFLCLQSPRLSLLSPSDSLPRLWAPVTPGPTWTLQAGLMLPSGGQQPRFFCNLIMPPATLSQIPTGSRS